MAGSLQITIYRQFARFVEVKAVTVIRKEFMQNQIWIRKKATRL